MKRSDLIKNISLGLIYPAILGSMIFTLIQFTSNTTTNVSSDFGFKMYVLLSAIIIYLFDYVKRTMILNYKFWMLIFDLFIIYNLFFLVQSSNIINSMSEPLAQKAFFKIGIAYFILAGYNNIFLLVTNLGIYKKQITE